ncbi:MAG TPA: glycine cleavage T C-terminal barrel domain-containing protein [Verrucomicrobiae bacterium]|jgi:folate-binding protein YgfZ
MSHPIAANAKIIDDYGDWMAEYKALHETAGILDLSFRSRICLVGNDRARFLHGQVTNDIKKLRPGEGCYAAIVTAKGKMESDANIFNLPDELLLDLEPGLTEKISARLEKFIVADDVQIVDAAPHYGLLSAQGPKAEEVIRGLNLFPEIPDQPFGSVKISDPNLGEIYLANHPGLNRWGEAPSSLNQLMGYDLFVPNQSLSVIAERLVASAKNVHGCAAGWKAFETVRIEAGIPRFGADMDETNLPLEGGIESRAVSYNKGCYIGQEVINRIHSIGHVNKELRGLRLADDLKSLPARGDKLFHNGKEAGYITSAVKSPAFNANIALGYVRREVFEIGTRLTLRTLEGERTAEIVKVPFAK